MSKKDWKKHLFRVKQLADQNLGRAARSEVLSDDLQIIEKRVELVRQVCHGTVKKLQACAVSSSDGGFEKRVRKLPEHGLYNSMLESANLLTGETLLGQLFQLCGDTQGTLAHELLQYEMQLESKVITPVQYILDNEIPAIQKLRKQLARLILDMDSARTRYQAAARQTHQMSDGQATTKVEGIRDELDDASYRVQQCRDQLATEMYNFVARESEYSSIMIDMVAVQADYHRKALEVLEDVIPRMHEQLEQHKQVPVFGTPLEEHLQRTNRDIAAVLSDCVCTLLEIGMEEEGLFRIAGGASKLKKLKAAFDFGVVDMSEYVRDVPVVAGVLKQYLRELPEPLLTFDLYDEWMKAAHISADQRVAPMSKTLAKLPKVNFNNLRYFIKFLAKLTEKSDVNKMTPNNLAIVIGPNLIWPRGDTGTSMLNASAQAAIVETMIINSELFFPGEEDFFAGAVSPHNTPPGTLSGPPSEINSAETTPPSQGRALKADTFLTPASTESESSGSPHVVRRLNKKPAPPPPSVSEKPWPPNKSHKADDADTDKSVEKSAEKSTEKSAEKSVEKSVEKLVEKSMEKSVENSMEKSKEKSTDNLADKSVDQSVSKSDDDSCDLSPTNPFYTDVHFLGKPTPPERPSAPPTVVVDKPPASPRTSTNSGGRMPADVPTSPRPERPRGPPPDRPQPPSNRPPDSPCQPPGGGSKPPRPHPPPRLSSRDSGGRSNDKVPPSDCAKSGPEETHL